MRLELDVDVLRHVNRDLTLVIKMVKNMELVFTIIYKCVMLGE